MTPHNPLLIVVLALPFAGSLLAALLPRHARNGAAWLAGSVALADLAMVARAYPVVADGRVIRHVITWLPRLDLNFTMRMDGFAWVFAALIAGIGLLVVIYARYY
ncbi:MAG: monovalent cation/H+ antiporter subunit A, partial [Acetobacteraceae bacterium]